MFQWTWDSVASECTNFLGPAGYGFVQGDLFDQSESEYKYVAILIMVVMAVSPPAEHITGPEWWTDYQPVSYTLTSKRGDRAQFSNMINACHAAGVKVIAGTIIPSSW